MYHIEEMANSPLGECKTPQPEIVNVIDEENKHRVYFPQCTVVHRCKNVSGCCGAANRECGPIRIEVIEKSFIVSQSSFSKSNLFLSVGRRVAQS